MKKMIVGFLLVSAFGCGESGDSTSTTVGFALTGNQATDDGGAAHTFDDIRFNVRHIEFDLPAGMTCDDVSDALSGARCEVEDSSDSEDVTDDNPSSSGAGKIVVDGPFIVDLKAGTTVPSLDAVEIPDLAYPRVDVRIDDDKLGQLDGDNSWLMTTRTTVADEDVSVEIALKFNEDIRFEAVDGVRSTGGPLLVAFDSSKWFDGLDLNACVERGDIEVKDGVVTISDDSAMGNCSSFEGSLKENLKRSGQLR